MARYSLSVLAIALLCVVANSCVLLFVAAPIAAEYWVRETLIVKRAEAEQISGARILLLGGSSTLFGIDAARLARELERPAFNFGLHASMRLDWILEEGRNAARSGDAIVLILEPSYFDCGSQDWTPWQFRNARAWGQDYLQRESLPAQMRASLTGGSVALAFETFRAWAGSPAALLPARRAALVAPQDVRTRYASAPLRPDFAYAPDNMNSLGDMQNTQETRYRGPAADVSAPSAVCPDVGVALRDFIAEMKARDIRVFMDYSPYLVDQAGNGWSAADASFASAAWQFGVAMLSRRDELFFPREMFFDTDLHLNERGRAIRTGRLIAHLKAAGV